MLNMNTLDDITKEGLFCDGDWIEKKDQDENGKVRLIQLADIGDGCFLDKSRKYINEETAQKLNCTFLQKGDILVSRLGVPLGKACIFPYDGLFITAVDIAIVRIAKPDISTKYMMHLINSSAFRSKIAEYQSGTTRKRISRKNLAKIEFYLPEFDEQERIVSRIEELFSELDNAVETLNATKKQLEVYRQTVLKAAFEGDYTNDWRKRNDSAARSDFEKIKIPNPIYKDTSGDENEVNLNLPGSWIKVRFGDVFDVQVGATPSRRISEYWNGDVNWVSSGEVRFNTIYHTEEKITADGLAHSSTSVHPVGTVMLAMIGEGKTRGQAAILNISAAHNQNTAAILVSETPCQPKYIYYYLQLSYDYTRRVGSGNNQKALNKERVRALRFPFASFEEQKEIVTEIESRLSVCESIENTVDTALAQASAMRQSILKQAFEGGLQ